MPQSCARRLAPIDDPAGMRNENGTRRKYHFHIDGQDKYIPCNQYPPAGVCDILVMHAFCIPQLGALQTEPRMAVHMDWHT